MQIQIPRVVTRPIGHKGDRSREKISTEAPNIVVERLLFIPKSLHNSDLNRLSTIDKRTRPSTLHKPIPLEK